MREYNFKSIEQKWQKKWLKNNYYKVDFSNLSNKYYALTMFSYPSGDRLHVGHWYAYGPPDTFARYIKMKGFNVFQPQGFDSFGLPAENYAIQHGVHPAESTKLNIDTMRRQLHSIGAMYDWENEINTNSPEYYKWTQWLFITLYERGLAYQKKAPVNWCPSCATVLANEQVKEGACERCDKEVTKKNLTQWFFKITDYADELLEKLNNLDWPEKTKHMQKNWIGKSVGAKILFTVSTHNESIEVFTTRPDTIFGASYIVLAPEHPLIHKICLDKKRKEVQDYIELSRKKSEIERTSTDKDKTGVFTGAYAINPLNKKEIPVWIADYVIASYGTGAVMAVPASDERDYLFANTYKLPIIEVVSSDGTSRGTDYCYPGPGISINSGKYSGMETEKVKTLICKELVHLGCGNEMTQYKLHDWLISRQRYWGAPIPIVQCESCGNVPVPKEDLPILLPNNIELSNTYGDDLSPLATSSEYINTACPKCGKDSKRDTDTMDTFVCSSWYYLRYPNAHYDDGPFDPEGLKWLPVDSYIGGAEHATMHLLYARFITKALRDCGYLDFDEPFLKLYHQGTITKDGSKMSKSRGNTVSPDEFIEKYGSDTFRAYLMFMGPYDEGGDWNDRGINGISRFIAKIWKFCQLENLDEIKKEDLKVMHKMVQAVDNDLEIMKFNTALSRIMECMNYFSNHKGISVDIKRMLIKAMAPLIPHISEELWEMIGNSNSVFDEPYPKYDKSLVVDDTISIAIQVNGKLRGSMEVEKTIKKNELLDLVKTHENVRYHLEGKNIIKEIVVPERLVNFVVK
tara:strand:+ start:332 stop:2734 length:2403 start_codon:yes stop_codon:yes gene_type:complete